MSTRAERLGAYKRELAELRAVAVELHNRIIDLEKSADELVGACEHPNAKDTSMMGAGERSFHCKDCGTRWAEPWEKPKSDGEHAAEHVAETMKGA